MALEHLLKIDYVYFLCICLYIIKCKAHHCEGNDNLTSFSI